jgi:dTMP kinase
MKWILELEFGHFAIPKPDLNIFLDVPFSFTKKKLMAGRSGEDRNYLNGSRDIHEESLSFQKKVREVYIEVSETDKLLQVIDCSNGENEILPPEKIFDKITEIIKNKG